MNPTIPSVSGPMIPDDLSLRFQHRFTVGDLIPMSIIAPEAVSSLSSLPGASSRMQQVYSAGTGHAIVNLLSNEGSLYTYRGQQTPWDSLSPYPDWQVQYHSANTLEMLELERTTS